MEPLENDLDALMNEALGEVQSFPTPLGVLTPEQESSEDEAFNTMFDGLVGSNTSNITRHIDEILEEEDYNERLEQIEDELSGELMETLAEQVIPNPEDVQEYVRSGETGEIYPHTALITALDELEAVMIPPVELTHIDQLSQEPNITLLPENSGTILVSETTSRFSSAQWYENMRHQLVVLAGIGGIGSYVAFLLTRLDVAQLVMFDHDVVDTVNLSGQLYGLSDVGSDKVTALSKMVKNYSNYNRVIANNRRFESTDIASPIMICGFDNMAARKLYFTAWKQQLVSKSSNEKAKCLFIDGRLAAEEYQVYAITGNDNYSIQKYERECLFTDDEADATICSYKQTTFMANQIASVMVNIFVNFVANQCEPVIDRCVPFFIEYNASNMYLTTVL